MPAKFPVRKKIRLDKYDYSQPGYYFVTFCTQVRFENILCELLPVGGGLRAAPSLPTPPNLPPVANLTALGRCVRDSIEQVPRLNPGVDVDSYIIMPDHVHLVLHLTGRHRGRPLPAIIGSLKSYTDHCYRKLNCPYGPYFWQEGYHDHIIRNDADLRATREYIYNNPLKWILDRN